MSTISTSYYQRAIDLADASKVEAELQSLINRSIDSVTDLEKWLKDEFNLGQRIEEVFVGHMVDFYRDTTNEEKKQRHLQDQAVIQPMLLKYQAELDRKFTENPHTKDLDEKKYGIMRKVRATNLELFREENVPLIVREQEIVTRYNELIGGLMVEWEGGTKPLPDVQALLDSPNQSIRERAWKAIRAAHHPIKQEIDKMMDELVQLRTQIAQNAGFANYRDYAFREKNREYSVDDCKRFHAAVEKFVVPVWDGVVEDLRQQLGADTYRPWDQSAWTIDKPPYTEIEELTTGVETMLRETDPEFAEIFVNMRDNGLLDLGGRQGKAPGGFNVGLPISRSSFVFANFSPSYFALIALVHEMGHAINGAFQMRKEQEWVPHRSEVAELFSHGMELLCLDKLNEFYRDPVQYRAAVGERIRRSFNMLMGPLSGDLFQHWMYENPNHTAAERDEMYGKIMKRFGAHPVDYSGLEDELGSGWIQSIHFMAYPFYNIEYSMAELGALQLLQNYRNDKVQAIAGYKRGAGADYNQSIAGVYAETGVQFDFSDEAIEKTAQFVVQLWNTMGE